MLSRYNVKEFWREAVRDVERRTDNIVDFERFNLVNRVVSETGVVFYPACRQFYMTPVTLTTDTLGNYLVSGGSWNSTTGVLTGVFATALDTTAHGKLVSFRIGMGIYIAYVFQVLTTTSMIVTGSGLPSSNGTVNEAMVIPQLINSAGVYIGDLPIMRTAGSFALELESTETDALQMKSLPELRTFRSSFHKTAIWWAVSGDYILLAKGDSLDTYGTLVLRYPRVPLEVSGDTHSVDIPDGIVMSVAIAKLKALISERYGVPGKQLDYSGEIQRLTKEAFNVLGMSKAETQDLEQAKVAD